MPPTSPRLRILSVGGNAISAFLSWRLSATNACDVTLVWKNGFEAVAQYGITFKSSKFGNERFKPRHVVASPEDAAGVSRASYDYVLLCVKALPDIYDLASVIESVVAPQHTCILVNTSNSLGIESYLEQRFPTNVVLSLVSGMDITQLGSSEFEQKGSADLWVGAANKNPSIPATIQNDMAEALSITLGSGQVECVVSPNIRQQQFERMIGPIAFHPASVIFETPSHTELLAKNGVRSMISGVISELTGLAEAQGCTFAPGFGEKTMETMATPSDAKSVMYQDFEARRPMEVETFLGSPIKLAQEAGLQVPRVETLYALLHNVNTLNLTRPPPSTSPAEPHVASRGPSGPPMRPPMHGPPMNGRGPPPGMRPGSRAPSVSGGPPPPMRRAPHTINGYPPRMNGNGYGPRGPSLQPSRRGSMDANDLEEFSHLMLYDTLPEGANGEGSYDMSPGDIALRERELALRQRELALREREYSMRRGPRMSAQRGHAFDDDDDEDGEDFFDPSSVPLAPGVDPDNLDMMSVTSRRTRKAPSAGQLRANPEMMSSMGPPRSRAPWKRPPPMKSRTSAALMSQMPGLHEELRNNPLMGYSSDRYANVDRHNMGVESRTNSLTAERLNELQNGPPGPGFHGPRPGGPPGPMSRRGSQSPGNPFGPTQRPPHRPHPSNNFGNPHGRPDMRPPGPPGPPRMHMNGGPMPNGPMNGGPMNGAPMNGGPMNGGPITAQPVQQQNGVSIAYPNKSDPQVRSLTGSASASAGSGESHRSAPLEFDPSAHSSTSSLGPRPPIGVR